MLPPPPTYHLRRVNPKPHLPEELILLGEVTKFGRNADNVDVVLTSAVYSNMISRDHAIITGRVDSHTGQLIGYKIRDNSLNGTYIDDKRVKDEMALHDSCVIKFGHMNGAAIKAGVAAPQANAEFSFVFEKCCPLRKYCGWDGHVRRKTVVCTGDGKPMTETGEDHRTRRKPPAKDVATVSSTTAPTSAPLPMQHSQPAQPAQPPQPPPPPQPTPLFNTFAPDRNALYQLISPWSQLNGPALNSMRQQPMAGMRPNGQYQSVPARGGSYPHQQPSSGQPLCPPLNAPGGRTSHSSTAPIRSPPVECDSSVPSPPKNGADTRTGQADSSSQHSPRRGKDDDEDSFSVPDSPPRAPRPHDVPPRSVTNSPAPPSPRPIEKIETPKDAKAKVVIPKKPTNPGKAPKSGGGGEKRKNNEVSRLLDDLTEGSFMLQQMKKMEGGTGSERRKASMGKKSAKGSVSKNKLHRQLSSASSDEDSDDDEASGVPVRRTSSSSRPSMVGKKASSAVGTSKGTAKRGRGKKESDESDPYEETDDSDGETTGMRKMVKTPLASAKKDKTTSKKMRRKKKKGSDESSGTDSEVFDDNGEKFYDTEDTKCEAVPCQMPGGKKVCWVACDGCDRWFHSYCQFGVNKNYTGTKYFCGCGEPPMKKSKKKKRN